MLIPQLIVIFWWLGLITRVPLTIVQENPALFLGMLVFTLAPGWAVGSALLLRRRSRLQKNCFRFEQNSVEVAIRYVGQAKIYCVSEAMEESSEGSEVHLHMRLVLQHVDEDNKI